MYQAILSLNVFNLYKPIDIWWIITFLLGWCDKYSQNLEILIIFQENYENQVR